VKTHDLEFETRWSMLMGFCAENCAESTSDQEGLRELLSLVATLPAVLLTRSRVKDVLNLIKVGMRASTACTRLLLREILGALFEVPVFWGEIDFGLIVAVMDTLPGADAIERRDTTGFLVECVYRLPAQRERLIGHLLEQLHNAAWSTDPTGARPLIQTLWELVNGSSALVLARVIPLLGSPGLGAFADVLGPWLQLLALKPQFREALLDRLIRGFPVSNRESALVFLWILERASVPIPQRLGRRLLSLLGDCIRRPYDDGLNKGGLAVLRSSRVAELLNSVGPEEVAPLVAGASETGPGSRCSCRSALGFVYARRPGLLREFIGRFKDREAATRDGWAAIAERAGDESVSTGLLKPEPMVARPTACPGCSRCD
jgi:hypothetical protein